MSPPLRITIVQGAFAPVPSLLGTGAEKVWHGLGREFARRGHPVRHLSRRYPGLADDEVSDGVHHHRVRGFDAPRSKALYRALDLVYAMRILRRLPDADILITNSIWLPLLVRGRRRGRLYVHVARFPKGQMRFYRHAGRLQAVSSAVAEAIASELPRLRDHISVIPPYLSNESPDIDVEATWAGRAKTILYVGRIHPEKGLHVLVAAFIRFKRRVGGDWRLAIAGDSGAKSGGGGDGYRRRIRDLAAPASDAVDWLGFVPQARLNRLYATASIFAYPSLAEKGESFGMAPLEAMSCGCPAIVSSLACFRDYLVPGGNGLIFDHRGQHSIEALSAALQRLACDEAWRRQLAVRAYEAARPFRLEPVADRYLADFHAVAAQP
jgi:glycosyltransferase involved in cell wall biosynthesis